jgi:hypothetical protein
MFLFLTCSPLEEHNYTDHDEQDQKCVAHQEREPSEEPGEQLDDKPEKRQGKHKDEEYQACRRNEFKYIAHICWFLNYCAKISPTYAKTGLGPIVYLLYD